MTSDHSQPVSDVNEANDPETQGESPAPVPIIDLPHRWDKSGKLVSGTSPSPCALCRWNGEPERLFHRATYWNLTGRDCKLEPFTCASCKLLRRILFKTAETEGRPVTDTSSVSRPLPSVPVTFDWPGIIWQSVFIPSDAPNSDIDRYNVARRFMWTHDRLNQKSFKWAQDRLAECASSHELCQSQSGDSFLPTRLINLQPGWNGLDVRLEDSDSVRSGSLYIALSYCWGDHRPVCITTVETLSQNKTRISWDKLPLTFQDAAAFTLSLGIQYLWIDSICIIQEDEEDWQREAGRMYTVYKNSYVTLAALAGRDSTSGLRTMSMKQGSVLLAELRTAQANYPLYLRRNHYLDNVARDNFDEICRRYPLLSRAWSYQERTVSARVIFFTESEMIFQCLDNTECECGATQDWRRGNSVQPNKTKIFLTTRTPHSMKGSAQAEEERALGNMSVKMGALSGLKAKMKHLLSALSGNSTKAALKGRARQAAMTWRNTVVWEYSELAITMPRDRLPAIGAIAEQFQCVRAGEAYLAGLWSGSLLDDLLWQSNGRHLRSPKPKERLERPFSLPTWSWASLRSSASYFKGGITLPKADVIEANCSYAGGRAFGVLQSSKLVLRGRVLHCLLKWIHARPSIHFHNGDAWSAFSCLMVYMDRDQDGFQNIPSQQEIDILEISTTPTGSSLAMSRENFLLLRRDNPDEFVYTRAGIATFRFYESGMTTLGKAQLPQEGFESIFESQSVLTTCEIR